MEKLSVDFPFRARYYQSAPITESTEQVWFVLHGQGELAEPFLEKFKFLSDSKIVFIAPEGLSRYYLDGFYGDVGATWMTREERLLDIQNYLVYLDAVSKDVMGNVKHNVRVTLLGFSQGAATASRWSVEGTLEYHRLILWGGIFPPDLDNQKGLSKLSNKEIVTVYGTRDKFLTDERLKEHFLIASDLEVDARPITFDGGHRLDDDTLLSLCN